jgi:heavy metal sensor kinase
MVAKMHETMQEQEQSSRAALASVRNKLLIIGLVAFGFTALGGVWLVRRGLRPIHRIAEAVSQVSEKDFQLRLALDKTPAELTTIVDKLHQTLLSLKNAFEREKQAAADISHELRTPIASLLATIQVCLRKPRQAEEYRNTLQTCADIGHQLRGLVELLLALARLDAGADRLNIEPVDVPELAEQCVEQIRPLAETQELSLRFERNGPLCVETDAGKLREVLLNLLHNAMQYNRPQGSVEVSVSSDDGHARLVVRDTGVGIPAKALPHLFERFYRVDASRHSETIHAGLGLSIVKGYLDLMGAAITVESVEGQGSTFSVLLPLAKDSPDDAFAKATGVHSA